MSKYLSYLLRHGAVKEGLLIDDNGNINVSDLLTHLKNKRFDIKTLEQLQDITKTDKKGRFTLTEKEGKWFMRANQGHSITKVSEEILTPITDPDQFGEVIHGTFRKKLPLILKNGLSKMSRNHIHFASNDFREVLIRNNANVFIHVDMQKAINDGIKFFVSDNNVILTPGNDSGLLEAKYFKKVVDIQGNNMLVKSENKIHHIPCAGCIVFKCVNDKVSEVCLVKTKSNIYGFPKGKRIKGESLEDCAIRELEEETSIKSQDIENIDLKKYVEESSAVSATRKGNVSTRLYVTKLTRNVTLAVQDLEELESCDFLPIDVALQVLMDKRKVVLEKAIELLQ